MSRLAQTDRARDRGRSRCRVRRGRRDAGHRRPAGRIPAATCSRRPRRAALMRASTRRAARSCSHAPSASERASLKAHERRAGAQRREAAPRSRRKGSRSRIGFGRDVAGRVARRRPLASLDLAGAGGRRRVARIDVAVARRGGAARRAARCRRRIPTSSVRFATRRRRDRARRRCRASAIARPTARASAPTGRRCSTAITAVIELARSAGARRSTASRSSIPRVSHQLVEPGARSSATPKDVRDIGSSGACEIDVKCVTPQSTRARQRGEGRREDHLHAGERQHVPVHRARCSTIRDDRSRRTSSRPTTASTRATAARTINTYWFFDAVTCAPRDHAAGVRRSRRAARCCSAAARTATGRWCA